MGFDAHEPRDESGRWVRLAGLMKATGGFTHDLASGSEPSEGYAVGVGSPDGKDWRKLPHGSTTARDLAEFARDHHHELSKPHRGIGGWSNDNPEWGEVRDALDIVEVHKTLEDALKAAKAAGQDAIFDLHHGKEIPVNHDLSIFTPDVGGEGTYDLSVKDGKLAFWKQILPEKTIHYTAKDGSRRVLDFNRQYLTDLASNRAVDKVGFLLADKDNAHTMDPERFRGEVAEFAIREDQPNPDHNGLWGKIVFPNREAAKAVLDNPDLGVSARIREGIERSDGSQIDRGIIHVLGTLDPQVSGMSGWQTADLSTESENLLDLTAETYENGSTDMADETKSIADYTEAEIEAMTEEELNSFLAAAAEEFEGILDYDAEDDLDDLNEREPEMALSNEARAEIDLANARSVEALSRLAAAEWATTRDRYMSAGVPVDLLDLAEPIFNRPSPFVVDLSNEGGGEINVAEIVAKFLDAAKGTIDLSVEAGHSGTFHAGDGEDPDKALLDAWDAQSS